MTSEREQSGAADRAADAHGASTDAAFPIVAIGASAGGLDAFERFFGALPGEPGMAFVLIQHLDPDHTSSLAELLQGHTSMPVAQVEARTTVEQGCVYVIPPGKRLTIEGGALQLSEPERPRGQRALIDTFFRSLADDQGERAACIILSGTGADGSVGLKSIKESGGVVFAQEPADAGHDGMPKSALATGLVDLSAPAGELAERLVEYHRSAGRIQLPDGADELPAQASDTLQKVLAQVHHFTGHDFSRYKRSTILRRIKRRMQVRQIDRMADYLDVVRGDDEEAQALMRDFLISVTNFFRDREAFQALQEQVIPPLVRDAADRDQVRVWVPGCATGEEAYSLAMLLCEALDAPDRPRLQILASDIDDEALDFARQGLYPDVVAADITSDRLRRFFSEDGTGYRVKSALQEAVLFAQHNLLRDPPFSRLDLVSCRNLLIYLDRDVQQDVFRLFHYALREDGYLFLGGSETADGVYDLFQPVDKGHRIYRRKSVPARFVAPPFARPSDAEPGDAAASPPPAHRPGLGDVHRDVMLEAYAPPSVIVDEHHTIRYLFGDVGRYLRPSEGEPSHDLLQMAPDALRVELRTALFQVFKRRTAAGPRRVVFHRGDRAEHLTLVVRPVEREGLEERLALVVFEPATAPAEAGRAADDGAEVRGYDADVVEQLEDELLRTRQSLSTTIEEYETSNEELKASNEELQSMNEELRSTTEELETSKEELQSTNEELQTLNAELNSKIAALNRAHSDLENLMASTHIGTLFLDRELCLKRYTPAATRLFHIIPADLHRPFTHLSHKIDHEDLPGLARRVLETLETREDEIRGRDGGHYLMRMLPYKTSQDRIDGVVVTFVDITEQKAAQEAERERAQHQFIVAELRHQALSGGGLDVLMDLAVRQVAHALGAELCKVLELQPEHDHLLLRAGVGWDEGLVGTATVGTHHNSQAGYTLGAGGAVVVDDLARERRFDGPPLLTDHGVVSGVSVVVQGAEQPYGVLGVHTTRRHRFTEPQVQFVQSVANVLGTAIEQRRAAEALAESEERIRLATEATGMVTWEWIPATGRVQTSANFKDVYGLPAPANDTAGFDLLLSEDREVHRREVQRIASEGGEYVSEFRVRRPSDGRVIWLEERARAYRDAQGSVARVVGIVFDVTRRKEAENALRESEARLAGVNKELEQRVAQRTKQVETLASSLTLAEQRERHRVAQILHDDLQQLLYGAQVQLRLSENALSEEDERAARQMASLHDVLSRAIHVARTLTVDLSPPVLEHEGLTDAVVWLASQMHELHGLTVDVEAESALTLSNPEMRVLLFQLVRELLFNVVKHAGVGHARVHLAHDGSHMRIRVEDAGAGFDVSALDDPEGSGFGLYSVQERLRLFGGRFELTSTPGEGTQAVITIPVDSADEQAS